MPSEPTSDQRHPLLDLVGQVQGDPAFDDILERNVREVREASRAAADADPWLD